MLTITAAVAFKPHLDKAEKLVPNLSAVIESVASDPSVIVGDDGTVLYSMQSQYRRPVDIEHIPQTVIDATLAAEDKRFYEHEGIDFKAMMNLIVLTLRSGSVPRGGSTLTMQLAKNVYTSPAKTISRKLDDMALAVVIEQKLTKDQILELYLNQVFYGQGAYGIGAAADVYFGKKDLNDLTVSEAALLARLVRRPSRENPFIDMDTAIKNRDVVLASMLELHYITKKQYEEALAEKPKLNKVRPQTVSGKKIAPYFVDAVMRQFHHDFPDADLKSGGYRIETTLDPDLQKYAEDTVKDIVKTFKNRKVTTGAFLLMDSDGAVLVHVGGEDYDRNQFDVITQGARQPGSGFKPIVYATALDRGVITPYDQISNLPYAWPDGMGHLVPVHNDDGKYSESVSVEYGLKKSINVVAARVMMATGPSYVVKLAHSAFGFTSNLAAVPALALGATAVSPLEMARAYSVFKTGGNRVEPYYIRRVIGPSGEVLKRYGPDIKHNVLDHSTAMTMDTLLHSVATSGTGWAVSSIYHVANARGKTGTTNDYRDAWFNGYTDRFIASAWVGSEVRQGDRWIYQSMSKIFGATAAAPMWGRIVKKAQEKYGEKAEPFQRYFPLTPAVGDTEDEPPQGTSGSNLPPLDPNKI
ncbi:MAG TPA: PBP1A family penicillin-binding protein, partial [Fimbriimonadaceae bacterium]|nr:PBP1A family penicillin-binding protein [Fimbriimonadaceae bacterium]